METTYAAMYCPDEGRYYEKEAKPYACSDCNSE